MTMYSAHSSVVPLCPCGVGFAEMSVPTANSSVNLGLTKVKYLVKTHNTTESN